MVEWLQDTIFDPNNFKTTLELLKSSKEKFGKNTKEVRLYRETIKIIIRSLQESDPKGFVGKIFEVVE